MIANKTCEVRIKPMIIISNRVVCITSVLENATPIANDRRVNNFIRIIVNKIWQMLAAIKKDQVVKERVLSITNSCVPKKRIIDLILLVAMGGIEPPTSAL